MTAPVITFQLPEDVHRRLQFMAEATHQPLEAVLFQTIRGNLPPLVSDLPPELRDELASLQNQSDEALWAVARKPLSPDQWRRHQDLLHENEDGTLTGVRREELVRLRAATDHFVFRRSYALALLKWRGYVLPVAETLTPDAPTPKDSTRRSPASR